MRSGLIKRVGHRGCTACVLFFLAVFACGMVSAQQALSEISASGLLTKASKDLSEGKYVQAVPYLTEYLERMKGMDDGRVLAMQQKVRLKLGRLMAHVEDSLSAINWLQQYIEARPLYQPREAFKLLAANLYITGEYERCISAVTNALARPLPIGLPKGKAVEYKELAKEELGGFSARKIARIEKMVAKSGAKLSEGLSDNRPDPEPDYTAEELVVLKMTLAESYTALENWKATIEPYQFVIEHTEMENRKGYAIMQLVNSLIALEEFEEAKVFIVQLARTDARYDIRVNMALMSAATALFNVAEYDSALMLYRMVLPREDLLEYQEDLMNEMRIDQGFAAVEIRVVTNDAGRVETLFGSQSSDLSASVRTAGSTSSFVAKPMALVRLEEGVQTLVSLPPYEDNVIYQTGRLFAAAGRPWEAVAVLELVAEHDLESKMGQQAFAESLMMLVDPLEKYDRVEERGLEFLKTYREGLGPRMVAQVLTSSYQNQERWKEIKKLLPVIDQFVVSDDGVILHYESELYYMQAIADVVLLNYQEAKDGFELVQIRFPESARQESAGYWHAMTHLFLKNHQKALGEFDAYFENWPDGNWHPSAMFHSGICLFGLENYVGAQKRFTRVIESWPDSLIYPDACSLRGDLLASQSMLDEAQHDYEEAIATAHAPRQATYAVFQMTAMFELERRYDEIIATVTTYLDRYGEEADVAKAAYWIGKTKLDQGLIAEALAAYRDAIVRYGGDVDQEGVDLIISELVKISRSLKTDECQALEENLRISLQEADNETLRLRLRVLMAKIDGSATELGQQLIEELDELALAPPPVLAVICDASFEHEDYSRAEEILNLFQTRYENSDFIRSAFKLRGVGLFKAGEYAAALKISNEVQALYGADREGAWAQLLIGQIALEKGDLEAARKTFRTVLTVREWRGEAYAEATFHLGSVEEQAGNPRKAFGWYQRTCFQYKGYAKGYWAAEGYLASARCLMQLGLENDMRNTFRAMLFDKYVNTLPQAEDAKVVLGADEVIEISTLIGQGVQTNLTVTLEIEEAE